MICVGIVLLLADRLSLEQRKAIGSTLTLVGLVTTIPAVWALFGKGASKPAEGAYGKSDEARFRRFI